MLASWIGIDTHGIGSAYIVTDSRFSWCSTKTNHVYDFGKKVFASKLYPEIFGYVGDVLFPSVVLSQLVDIIDSDLLLDKDIDCSQKSKIVCDFLSEKISVYPRDYLGSEISIIHISRDTIVRGYPKFYAFQYSLKKEGEWKADIIKMPEVSGLLTVLGSGAKEFLDNYKNFQKGNNSDTSRNVFHCFSHTLSNMKYCSCGGAPQLVGLYRKPNSSGKHFGIVYNGQRYFLGSPIQTAQFENIEWRNELFELVDGKTMKIFEDAERQPIGIKTS